MVLMTMIARVADGLPLAATMQEDEQAGRNILDYQNQAKMLFRKLGPQSPPRCTIETGPYLFHYLIEHDICYLVLCEKNYSKRLAYSYLDDIAQEFHTQYGKRVNTVTRPYTFIEFDNYIQKAKKIFMDSRARRNLSTLNNQLHDVQRIMVQNIDDVLQRGTVLSELDTKTQNLSILTQKYKKGCNLFKHEINVRESCSWLYSRTSLFLILLGSLGTTLNTNFAYTDNKIMEMVNKM